MVEKVVRRMRWRLRSFILIVLVLGAGALLWWIPESPHSRFVGLGTALVGGSIVALAIFFLEWSLSRGNQKRDLQLRLGVETNFRRIDLRGEDLSGAYLAHRNFTGARFDKADLRGANLEGANLSGAEAGGCLLCHGSVPQHRTRTSRSGTRPVGLR